MNLTRRKYLFIDRDGTLIDEPKTDFQIDSYEKLKFEHGVIKALSRIVSETDYRLVIVTNQDGLGTASMPLEDFEGPHQLMLSVFEGEGITFDEVLIDDSFERNPSANRKPAVGLVRHYLNDLLDKDNSYVIGDRWTDIQLAKNMGLKGILYKGEAVDSSSEVLALKTDSWSEIAEFLIKGSRKVSRKRKTSETSIAIDLDLNGSGRATIQTGIAFFDHMLEQIGRHGLVDLAIRVDGDLQVDEHHTIEDTGILLGEVFKEALGSKRGLARYGFALPMDESQAQVLLDFGGRAHLIWDAQFSKEYVGDFPTDMAKHFFESFAQGASCNLNISACGQNDHHIVEAIFKAFSRAIKQAIQQSGNVLPSSKGVL
jgi:imidazoleglycerol-phosphate dehydratase / histidinol-phosphatase